MSIVEYNKLFETKYMQTCDNVFEALNLWSQDAKTLEHKTRSLLSSNEALNACLDSKLPDNFNQRILISRAEKMYIDRYIKEALSQIDDIDVKKSVCYTLIKSRQLDNLVFVYLDNLSTSQKSRVRIISRMVWYNLYSTKGN